MSERKTARTKYDPRTHATMDTGWQTLSLCGRRITWLNGQEPIDPGAGVVDCEACLEIMREASVTDLAGFLLARLAEDERIALESGTQPWNFYSDGHWGAVREFLQRWNPVNPARVLAEVAAKRRIVEVIMEQWRPDDMFNGSQGTDGPPWLLRVLAQPYADHADFDPAWKVER